MLSLQHKVPQPAGAGPCARRVLGAAVAVGRSEGNSCAVGVSSGEGESRGANTETEVLGWGSTIRDSVQDLVCAHSLLKH